MLRFSAFRAVFSLAAASLLFAAALFPLAAAAEPGAQASPEEISAGLRDPHRIFLKAAAFDVRQGPQDLPARLLAPAPAPGEPARWIVQFSTAVTEEMKAAARSAGALLGEHLPVNAFAARMTPEEAQAVRALPSVQHVGPFHPAYKLDPEIGTRMWADAERAADPNLRLYVHVFEDADVGAVAARVTAAGVEVLRASPTSHRLRVLAGPDQLEAIARVQDVSWVEEFPEITQRNDTTRWVIQTNVSADTSVWAHGLHGEGQIVGVTDGRIDRNSCYFLDTANNTPGPGHRKLVSYHSASGYGADSHGTHVGGIVAGYAQPVTGLTANRGMAYQARIAHANLNDVAYWGGSTDWEDMLQILHDDGARIFTNSWGDDGTTAYISLCRDSDVYSRNNEDGLVLFAETNLSSLKTPENAKNVVAVGATSQAPSQQNRCFGGVGPTNDGRRKPEIYSPGCGIISARNSAVCDVRSLSGTSMASPATAGATALIRQYYGEGWYPTGYKEAGDAFTPTGALLKATLLNGTVDMTGVAGYPSNTEGWGRTLLENALHFGGDARKLLAWDVRHAQGLATAGLDEVEFLVTGNAQALKVTLVFTDQPAALFANPAPINDLDLEIVTPTVTYLGNRFVSGQSATGGAADNLNNVEMVLLATPEIGTYTARVLGTNVPSGPQGYALVVTGEVQEPQVVAVSPETGSAAGGRRTRASAQPNPFNPSVTVSYEVADAGNARLAIYDVSGRLVRTLLHGTSPAGAFQSLWDGRDDAGRPATSGVYFYRLETVAGVATGRMALVR